MKFNAVLIVFILFAFSTFKILYANSNDAAPHFEFPTLDPPDIEFRNVSGGCGGFIDCTEYLGAVLFNIGAGIIFLVLFLIELIVYVIELFALIVEVTFTGFAGAPWWVNALSTLPFFMAIGIIIYRLVRSGESEN